MSSTYSSSLRVELIGSGDQAGAWGATTDNSFAYVFDTAIAGYQAVPITSTSQALTYVNGATATANLNQAVYAMLKFTGASAATSVYIPPVSKQYIVYNNSGYAITIYNSTVIGNTTAAGTGITVANGDKILVWSEGTNVLDVKSSGITGTIPASQITGTLPIANGGTGQTTAVAAFNALSTSAVYIDGSSNVGIGTTSVATNFRTQFLGTAGSNTSAASSGTTQAASAVLRLQAGGGFTGTLDIGQGGATGSWLQSCDTTNLATTYSLLLNPVGGNVGIGTSSPVNKLDVTGAAGTNGDARSLISVVDSTAFALGVGGGITFRAKYNTAGSYFDAGNIKGIKENATDGNSASALAFSTQANGGSPIERMRIDSSGNVGIGTSSPGTYSAKLAIYSAASSVANIQITNPGVGTGTIGIAAASSNFKIYNSYTSGTLASGAGIDIDSSGNVGIGTSSPTDKLTVSGVARTVGGNGVYASGTVQAGNLYYGWEMYNVDSSTNYLQSYNRFNSTWMNSVYAALSHEFLTSGTEKARISSAGGFSVGTTADPGAGAIYATGNITAYYSDDRLKTRFGNIENALDKVKSLDGFYYEANQTAQDLGYKPVREAGVSAQQVQAILPEVVKPAPIDQQYLTVDYERLVPLLIEAIKELNGKVETLEAKLKEV
jgi:hypothetical protein